MRRDGDADDDHFHSTRISSLTFATSPDQTLQTGRTTEPYDVGSASLGFSAARRGQVGASQQFRTPMTGSGHEEKNSK